MDIIRSTHASKRAQQRGIPLLIQEWLLAYGEEKYDHRGGVVHYFSRASLRVLEKAVGRDPIRRLSDYLDAYLVASTHDGTVITVGKRYRSVRILNH